MLAGHVGVEKIDGAVAALHEAEGVALGANGRELEEVAKDNHLAAAEREFEAAEIFQLGVDHVEDVGGDHGDFVDDDSVELLEDFDLALLEVGDFFEVLVVLDAELKLEKGVNGLAGDIESGDTGGSEDGEIFLGMSGKVGEEDGFARAGFASDEKVVVGFLEEIVGALLLFAEAVNGEGRDGGGMGGGGILRNWVF